MFCSPSERKFEQTVRAYSADLYRYAYWLCRDRFVAEDLVQQTFERAWKHWRDLHDMECAKSWLITILRREHARLYQRKRPDTVDDDPETLDLPASMQADSQLELEQMVAALPLAYRETLLLQTLGGYSCSEIAAMLGTSEGAVMTRLTRARHALRAYLAALDQTRISK